MSDDRTIGLDNLATINKSLSSLYNPIVVTYGWNVENEPENSREPVAKSRTVPLV